MVLAYHLVWTSYGWWLPNDPRGSMSRVIASNVLKDLGELHYGRKRIQPASSDIRQFYENAISLLKFPFLTFSDAEIAAVGQGFADAVARCRYTCHACAILPDHVHLVIRKHRDLAEDMIGNLQAASRSSVLDVEERHLDHPVWGRPGWKVYEDSREDIERTIRYVERNLTKARRPPQAWSFVTPYDGWPFHRR